LELFHCVDVQFRKKFVVRFPIRVMFYPLVLQGFLSGQPALGSRDQFLDQILGLAAHVVPLFAIEVELALADHLEDLLVVVAVEGWIPTEQNVKDAACRPHIATHIVVTSQNFGRNIVGRSSSGLHSLELAAGQDLGEPKVNNLEV